MFIITNKFWFVTLLREESKLFIVLKMNGIHGAVNDLAIEIMFT